MFALCKYSVARNEVNQSKCYLTRSIVNPCYWLVIDVINFWDILHDRSVLLIGNWRHKISEKFLDPRSAARWWNFLEIDGVAQQSYRTHYLLNIDCQLLWLLLNRVMWRILLEYLITIVLDVNDWKHCGRKQLQLLWWLQILSAICFWN